MASGRLHPVRTFAVIGDVEVALQDLVFGQPLLQRNGVAKFADFPLHGGRLGIPDTLGVALSLARLNLHHLDVLLGDRRAALHTAVAGGVADQGPHGALEIERAVLVETMIFDRELRLSHDGSNLVELHRDTVLVIEVGQHLAVAHQYLRARGGCRRGQFGRNAVEFGGGGAAADARHARYRNEQAGNQNPSEDAHNHEHDQ